jgi:hypothetical protein
LNLKRFEKTKIELAKKREDLRGEGKELIRYDKSSLGKGDAEKRTETEKIGKGNE